ncbi:hypothetical protein FYJ73_14965 [Prevotellaceae bacterium LKV-178-WT-2A]|uniref:Uncharacterized protein n=1 Tax=Hallella mizrahii TaxID=2606637 RepID=A0A7K0KJ68_9BACT|nr:hypothetical protein [Hallella mizrahii]
MAIYTIKEAAKADQRKLCQGQSHGLPTPRKARSRRRTFFSGGFQILTGFFNYLLLNALLFLVESLVVL